MGTCPIGDDLLSSLSHTFPDGSPPPRSLYQTSGHCDANRSGLFFTLIFQHAEGTACIEPRWADLTRICDEPTEHARWYRQPCPPQVMGPYKGRTGGPPGESPP